MQFQLSAMVLNDLLDDGETQARALHVLEGSADLMDVVKGLNALGATPQDLMVILQALKAAGSLRAELEII